jgi:ERCC4-type nuclease
MRQSHIKTRLVIDNRETWWGEKTTHETTQPLDLGDFSFESSTGDGGWKKGLLVERKTVKDLIASIKDRRFKDQLDRLRGLKRDRDGSAHVMFVIEGVKDIGSIHDKAAKTAITNLMVREGIPVIFTCDMDETRELLRDIAHRISCSPERYVVSSSEGCVDTRKQPAKKGDRFDIITLCTCILACYPGISVKTAEGLVCESPPTNVIPFLEHIKALAASNSLETTNKRRISRHVIDTLAKTL